eukprot:3938462-Rhodomonas_salina.3
MLGSLVVAAYAGSVLQTAQHHTLGQYSEQHSTTRLSGTTGPVSVLQNTWGVIVSDTTLPCLGTRRDIACMECLPPGRDAYHRNLVAAYARSVPDTAQGAPNSEQERVGHTAPYTTSVPDTA